MADINVNFLHPTNGSSTSAEVEDGLTVDELKDLLISEEFIQGNKSDIELILKGQGQLLDDATLSKSGVTDGSSILVNMATNAGTL